ncbi:MAG: phage portal protein [Thermomicrobium sp.]|nr:phage portal protein [Thermomicrobium sp.]MDW8060004.1 phage portal protein [Thermomicrobium sp.]
MQNLVDEVLLRSGIEAEIAHAAAIERRWRLYHGDHRRQLRVKPGQPDDNVVVNFARVVVDKGVAFLFGSEPRFELDELHDTEAEAWLERVWAQNRKLLLLQQMALSGAIAGHVFVKIVRGQPIPRLVLLDPATVWVQTRPDDYDAVEVFRIQFPFVDPADGRSYVYREVIGRDGAGWAIVAQRSRTGSHAWETLAEESWPYPWPPVAHTQNLPNPHAFWGVSDLEEDVIRLNDAINFLLSNLLRIVRYHAHPRTWGRGFTAAQLNVGIDETIVLPSEHAELRNLEMQSDLGSSIALYQRLREALHEITRIPEVATGKVENLGSLSGVALAILYQPLLEKTQTKRLTYGTLLEQLNQRLLELGGFGADQPVTIHWPPLLPSDFRADAETGLVLQQLGVSQDTILQRLGFDPEIERQKREYSSADVAERLLEAFDHGH